MDGEISGSKAGITAAVLLAALMAVLDISIVNVALSDIRAAFATPLDRIGWISTSYMMATVVVIPLTGWFQRRLGVRPYFTGSILLFTLASVLCGLAWSLPSLIAFRVLQGIGGGAIIPTSQAILLARYPRKEHTMAGALFGLASVAGPLLGPTVGGYLISWWSWHWIFLVNLPVGLGTAALAWRHLHERRSPGAPEPIDRFGIVLLVVGMAGLQYVLEEGNRHGWWEDRWIVLCATLTAIALVTFVAHELETPHPVVELRVFVHSNFAAGTALNLVAGMTQFSSAYLISLFCGAVMGYAALDIGLVFLWAGAVQLLVMPLLGRFGARIDGRLLLGCGLTLLAASFWGNGHLSNQAGYFELVVPQMLRSIGLGFIFVPLTVITLSDLPASRRGNATGLFNLMRELGGTLGTAWMGTLVERHTHAHLERLADSASRPGSPLAEQAAAWLTFGGRWADVGHSLALLLRRFDLQALELSFNDAFLAMLVVVGAGLAAVAALRPCGSNEPVTGGH